MDIGSMLALATALLCAIGYGAYSYGRHTQQASLQKQAGTKQIHMLYDLLAIDAEEARTTGKILTEMAQLAKYQHNGQNARQR